MRNLFVLIAILGFTFQSNAQFSDFFQQSYFFGWLPGATSDAMGRADVAVGGTVNSLYKNPAGLGLIERAEFNISTAAPFYVLNKSDYWFVGGAWRFHPKFVGAISLNILAIGPNSFDININGARYPTDKPISSNLALSIAGSPIQNLNVGLNFNLFRWKYIEEVSAARTFHMDVGLLYTFVLDGPKDAPTKGVRFGASVVDFFSSDISFKSPLGDEASNTFPVIGRYALAYFNKRMIKLPGSQEGGFSFIGTVEVQDLYNSKFRTAFRLGTESKFYDVFAFRLGFYTISQNDMGIESNKSSLTTLTYGFGIVIPIEKISKGNTPINIHLDYTSLPQPPFNTETGNIPNMRSFGLRCVWTPIDPSKKEL